MTDESALRGTLVAQQKEAEESNPPTIPESSQLLSPAPEHDMWSDFILPEHLFTPEAIGPFTFQDFPSLLTPQASFPEVLAPMSPGLEPLSPGLEPLSPGLEPLSTLAFEDAVGSNLMEIVEPHNYEIMGTFCQETGSTESTLSAQLSNG